MEKQINDLLIEVSNLKNDFIETSKNILEVRDNGVYALDFLSLAVSNRAISLSNAFVTLAKEFNYLTAASLIRLQLDNVLRFYEAFLVKNPDDFIKHFLGGKAIKDFKDSNNENLTDSYLTKSLEKYFPGTIKLYKDTSGFIHLSDRHFFPTLNNIDDKTKFADVRIGSFDNFKIDQKIDLINTMLIVSRLVLIVLGLWKIKRSVYF